MLEKDEILNRVDKMMEKKRELSPEFIRKMFPDDGEYMKIGRAHV